MKPRHLWKQPKRRPLRPGTAPIARSTTRIPRRKQVPTINRAKAARKLAKYAAFMKSPAWRVMRLAALERAGHQCEQITHVIACGELLKMRCLATDALTVHHVRYSRFGGRELPRDLQVLCKAHHEKLHQLKGTQMLWQKVSA